MHFIFNTYFWFKLCFIQLFKKNCLGFNITIVQQFINENLLVSKLVCYTGAGKKPSVFQKAVFFITILFSMSF